MIYGIILLCLAFYFIGAGHSQYHESKIAENGGTTLYKGIIYRYVKVPESHKPETVIESPDKSAEK